MSSELMSDFFQNRADDFYSVWPQKSPGTHRLRQCRLIAHRGEHDNFNVMENTLEAFEICARNQIWGIELDLRWTEDLQPVVLHDPDCGRVFGRPHISPAKFSLKLLRQHAPFIPTLEEVVEQFGFQCHLMIELKESLSDPDNYKVQRIQQLLTRLRPVQDYHFMSFSSEILRRADFVPSQTCLGIAEFNVKEMSKECLKRNYGGLTAHYLLVNKKTIHRHHQAKQKVGVGFVSSKKSLFRELNRKVDWLFTNHALKAKRWLDGELRNSQQNK